MNKDHKSKGHRKVAEKQITKGMRPRKWLIIPYIGLQERDVVLFKSIVSSQSMIVYIQLAKNHTFDQKYVPFLELDING